MDSVNQVSDLTAQPQPDVQDDAIQKKAEQIIQQLGLHPSQTAAQTVLGLGVNKLPNAQKVAPVAPQLVSIPTSNQPNAVNTVKPNPPELLNTQPLEKAPAPEVNNPPTLRMPSPKAAAIPGQVSTPDQISKNSQDSVLAAQNELARMQKTGSGISQIKNPFLRVLAHIGEGAETAISPGAALVTPGTAFHHELLEKGQRNLIDTGLANEASEATTQHTNAETAAVKAAIPKNDLEAWMSQNVGVPVEKYWEEKAKAKGTTKIPTMATQTFEHFLNTPGTSFEDAVAQTKKLLADTKPETKEQDNLEIQGLLEKAMPDGEVDPAIMTNLPKLSAFIMGSAKLDDEEKGKLLTHFILNPSPASTGTTAETKGSTYAQSRIYPAIDADTGNLSMPSAARINQAPLGKFIPATQGQTSLTKEATFKDIHFNIDQTQQAIQDLKNDFNATQRAQFSYMLRSNDPHSALDSFLNSQTGRTLTPDQIDYVTALAAMQENALALRSIQGLGQGSDEMRAAILKMIPGPNTPSKEYAERQLGLFTGTVSRFEQGVAHTGIKQPTLPSAPKTGENKPAEGKSRTFSKSDIEAVAKQYKISYAAAKADAEKHGNKVVE